MNEHSIANIIRRDKENRGEAVDLTDMILQKAHHIIRNDGHDIVVFGLTSAITFLAHTSLIQGDGTFTCLVHPFTQLYIFHALLKNGVSYHLLYCLVRGKNQPIYERLIKLVEKIALEHGPTILNRPVRMMVDFEQAFIAATRELELPINISCCFFHFVSNIKKHARPVIDNLKKAVGEDAMETKMVEKVKRALMMLPFFPLTSSPLRLSTSSLDGGRARLVQVPTSTS